MFYGGGHYGRLILANSKYEAVGYYLTETEDIDRYADEVDIEEVPNNHQVEVSCIRFPVYKTVQVMYNEQVEKQLPISISEII
ncbi:hypothetical protein MZM54_00500 [[Brevibacterium] frigoritolerans]|nr:hypothetical protein [Peribacillus frigoritolerans]